MPILFVEGLRFQCEKCGAIRLIPRKGGLGPLRVYKGLYLELKNLLSVAGRRGETYIFVLGLCKACIAPILISPPQALAEESQRLLGEMEAWDRSLQRKCVDKVCEVTIPGKLFDPSIQILKTIFPILYQDCFDEPLCALYPDYFTKMKRRFQTQLQRRLEREGFQIPVGFREWLDIEVSTHPFADAMKTIQVQIDALASGLPGPWIISRIADFRPNGNMNPCQRSEERVFVADEESETLIYYVEQADPKNMLSQCESVLLSPSTNPVGYIRSSYFESCFMEKISAMVDSLSWSTKTRA